MSISKPWTLHAAQTYPPALELQDLSPTAIRSRSGTQRASKSPANQALPPPKPRRNGQNGPNERAAPPRNQPRRVPHPQYPRRWAETRDSPTQSRRMSVKGLFEWADGKAAAP